MEKEQLIEFFKEKNIDYLKLGQVVYEKSKNQLSLTFLYNELKQENLKNDKKLIEQLIKEYLAIEIELKIKYVKAFLDEERVSLVIKNFLKENYIANFYALKKLTSSFENNTFTINLEVSLTDDEIENLNKNLLKFLEERYFYNFVLKFIKVKNEFNSLETHKQEILDNLVQPIKINKMKVNKLENIIGEITEFACYPFEYYNAPEENILLCGNLLSIEEIEFTKKDGETKGLRYSLKVKCLEKVFNASLFPSKKNLEIVKNIQAGIDVIMQGSLDNFNNSLSLKVKNLAKCVVLDYEKPKRELNKEFKDYKLIKPQKYEEISQINLFDTGITKDYLLNNEFVVFDFETTGLEYMTDKITEIGAVKIKNGVICETFTTLINPQKEISEEITSKTGIDNEMVKDAPLFEDVVPDFYKFCKNAILVGHNVQFDYGFLDYHGRKASYVFDNKKDDTYALARKYIFETKNHKLKTIADFLQVSLINAHRALNDALATAKVFIKIVDKYY